ncbi:MULTISPECIES: hypothetical protein [Sphingosinicellaceae]|uniref:hypothetical protein n=1 Tax=Sphingosinicellaceae TaxID=2820280 RepID=UPI001C1E8D3E|nr:MULTISPECIES: hypothetical protein [Polymorphobacter]QYE34001.1 hypothetical protein KZX46_14410 [Polymorphobacter sp. PAMC 29334]UAJ09170.1 hypothetical protein KTC28_12565 [Polymorphobacter megasporae]
MADTTTLERLSAAVDRIEAAAAKLRGERDRAAAKATALDVAAGDAISALDALIAEAK